METNCWVSRDKPVRNAPLAKMIPRVVCLIAPALWEVSLP